MITVVVSEVLTSSTFLSELSEQDANDAATTANTSNFYLNINTKC